jgi:choline dehydrogenase
MGGRGFDVVVVGGGAAGCVMAGRLAERSSRSVLLIEAGPDIRRNLPEGLRDGWRIVPTAEIDWGYRSEPDAEGDGMPLRRLKALGGTSWVTRYVVRGAPADYEEWARRGNPGWGFADMLPYLRRLETDLDFPDVKWHGSSGPLPVTRYPEVDLTDVAAAGQSAVESAGFASLEDHNQPGALGVGRMPRNSRAGQRMTPADVYLSLDDSVPNLTIRCETRVDRVILDDGRAGGVVLADGSSVRAGHVVLCGGTYGTPAVLMRSGIGPAEDLRSLGIVVTADLPGVGTNLSDHATTWIECGCEAPSRRSPILDLIATFHSSAAASNQAPDLAFWFTDPQGDPPSFDIEVVLLRPEARGSVSLRSPDPRDSLRITLPPRDRAADLDRMVEGFGRALEVARSNILRRAGTRPPVPRLTSEPEIREHVTSNVHPLPHVIGTCAMGPDPEEGAVVDAAGSVHGVNGLTLADASIIPVAHSGFTHVVVIAAAEKIAEQLGSML